MNWDKKWESFYRENYGNKYPETPLIRFINKNFNMIENKKEIKIMDLGCGSGATVSFLSKEGFSTYGIDASKTAIKYSEQRLKNEKLEAKLLVGDFKKLPYKNSYFNCITDIASLQHNDDDAIRSILSEVHRTLVSDGLIFLMLIKDNKELSDKQFYTNYIDQNKIDDLLHQFNIIEKNYLKYSENNGANYIEFYLIEAQKK